MDKRLREAFGRIQPEGELIRKTEGFLLRQIHGKTQRRFRAGIVSACAVLLLTIGWIAAGTYFSPEAYIDLDINPSVALTLNRFGRVLDVAAYNEEGAETLRSIPVRHMAYADASRALLDGMIEAGYLPPDGLVSVTVRANDSRSEQEMLDGLRETVASSLTSHHLNAGADIFAVSQQVRDDANSHNISPAKYVVISELRELDESATYEGCAHHSINEIRRMIDACGEGRHGNNAAGGETGQSATEEPADTHHSGGHGRMGQGGAHHR